MMQHRSTLTALIVGLLIAVNIQVGLRFWRDGYPASDWINIEGLIVRDADPGGDPGIIYQRTIKQDVAGTWIVMVRKFRDETDRVGVAYCAATGGANYKAGAVLPPAATKLSWLMDGKDCSLMPGIYRADITLTLSPDGQRSKIETESSNYFFVPKRSVTQ